MSPRNLQERATRLIGAGSTLILATALAATLSSAGAFAADEVRIKVPKERTVTLHEPDTCFEDQPCWDCYTHGNRMCGGDKPGYVYCGSPNVHVTRSECEALMLEDGPSELPRTE